MMLNTFSGRTFNDVNQYPVYPWVLAEYQTSAIDIRGDDSVYRKLELPVGALNEKRLDTFVR
jgi:hypothetical protein